MAEQDDKYPLTNEEILSNKEFVRELYASWYARIEEQTMEAIDRIRERLSAVESPDLGSLAENEIYLRIELLEAVVREFLEFRNDWIEKEFSIEGESELLTEGQIRHLRAQQSHNSKLLAQLGADPKAQIKKAFGCFMGNCKLLYDPKDPCEDYEARAGKWGECHEFVPMMEAQLGAGTSVITGTFNSQEWEKVDDGPGFVAPYDPKAQGSMLTNDVLAILTDIWDLLPPTDETRIEVMAEQLEKVYDYLENTQNEIPMSSVVCGTDPITVPKAAEPCPQCGGEGYLTNDVLYKGIGGGECYPCPTCNTPKAEPKSICECPYFESGDDEGCIYKEGCFYLNEYVPRAELKLIENQRISLLEAELASYKERLAEELQDLKEDINLAHSINVIQESFKKFEKWLEGT